MAAARKQRRPAMGFDYMKLKMADSLIPKLRAAAEEIKSAEENNGKSSALQA